MIKANSWLQANPKIRIKTCESFEVLVENQQVNTDVSIRLDYQHTQTFVRCLRCEIVPSYTVVVSHTGRYVVHFYVSQHVVDSYARQHVVNSHASQHVVNRYAGQYVVNSYAGQYVVKLVMPVNML